MLLRKLIKIIQDHFFKCINIYSLYSSPYFRVFFSFLVAVRDETAQKKETKQKMMTMMKNV